MRNAKSAWWMLSLAEAALLSTFLGCGDSPKEASPLTPQAATQSPSDEWKKIFFEDSGLLLDAIRFDLIQDSHFKPALLHGLALSQARLEAIRTSTEKPTFENTIEAIEAITDPLERVTGVFHNYLSMKSSDLLEQTQQELEAQLTGFSNSIVFDETLFKRVQAVYQEREQLKLTAEQKTLLEKTYRAFLRNGVNLSLEDKKRLDALDVKIALLGQQHKINARNGISQYQLVVTDPARLRGIPETALQNAASQAKPGSWIFTLNPADRIAILTYADDRSFREEIWRAYQVHASSPGRDNRPVALEILQVRAERARLLGYQSHSHYVLEERMARNPETVVKFLGDLEKVYQKAARAEFAELQAFAGHELRPWDQAYYAEKLQKARYGFDSEELRPYFPLPQVMDGALLAAARRYEVSFVRRTDIPTWDSDVIAYEIRDEMTSPPTPLALFYLDPFPRDSKRQGAWMSAFQTSGMLNGKHRKAHVINVGNFSKPVNGQPALLSLDEVTTVYHELGHAFHAILSKAKYRSLSGTNVAWDFVELPSQLNENWATSPEMLSIFARHYKTGDVLPSALIEKLRKAENFQAGLRGLRQVSFGMLDMALHTLEPEQAKKVTDVMAFEAAAMAPYQLYPETYGFQMSPHFSHLFSGGYSSGYYSYKWAELLAADAFSVFQKAGIFDPEYSARFRREIMEKGSTEDEMTLYRRFRGGDPDPLALLRKEGLVP